MALIITNLPKEVLALIFENLTKPNDRRRAAQVCKLFHDIVRHQSTLKRNNVLKLRESAIRVIENSEIFPFSKLHIFDWHQDVILESAFWSLHGEKINEIIFYGGIAHIGNALPILNAYFPNLKKLTIEGGFSASSVADHSQAAISLPIEEMVLDISDASLEQSLTLLRCSPKLKKLEIQLEKVDYLPQILPWLEEIESSRLNFIGESPLEKLINLPSKVVIGNLTIEVDETLEMIRKFFKRPRTIETLSLYKNEEFDEGEEADEDNPAFVYFTRDQTLALGAAKSIKNVHLPYGALEFEGSLDLLAAQLPGLETISLDFDEDLPIPLYPFYWSLPESAEKIRQIYDMDVSKFHCLAGLSSLTSISISNNDDETGPRVLSSDEIQTLIRNCPILENLKLPTIVATNADLIGHGDILPFSSLNRLESLEIEAAPNITAEAFKSAFKFPNLEVFDLGNYNSSEEQPFNQNVAKLFTQNCPNLEYLDICNCHINEEGFDYLIRHLPYLWRISIQLKGHSLSNGQVEVLQNEFPYIDIDIDITPTLEATSE